MGFVCIQCNEREIWAFETYESMCLDCFLQFPDWKERL